jgi:hypothetical protein
LVSDDSPYADRQVWRAGRVSGEGTHDDVAVIWDSVRELDEYGPLLLLAMVWALDEYGLCYLQGLQVILTREEEERKVAKLQKKYSTVVGETLES